MVYYGSSTFYPIIRSLHNKIVRYAPRAVRQPVLLVNDAIAPLQNDGVPQGIQVALLDDRVHVVTVKLSSPSEQFSQSHDDIEVVCTVKEGFEVKK